MIVSVRLKAVKVLLNVLQKQRKADVVLEQSGEALDSRDRGLLHELVMGVLRHFFSLEADVSRFLKQKPDIEARITLLVGAYQIRHMRIPSHAAVSECVNVMKVLQPKASGMVNAVLRKVVESEAPHKLKPYQRAELPKWMYNLWRDTFGQEEVQAFAKVLQSPPRLCVAVFANRASWIQQVLDMGIEAVEGKHSPYAVLLPVGTAVKALPGFDTGAFIVMDQAAQMAVLALDVHNPKVILDICAAPGGKTALLAHRFPQATIIAIELNGKRIPRLQENLTRLGCRNVSVVQANALALPFLEGCVDAIFLDAPCSASGILRRHPDAKFLQHQEALNGLVETQKHALASAMHVLKQSRTLVYAVCSIHPQENECIVDTWQPSISIRLFPSDTHDGFFFSRIEKAKRENNV